MSDKTIPRPDRIRHVPAGFGWVDHRFVRDGHIRGLSREALALYLFLVTVANEDGISWYSEEKLCLLTGLESADLSTARRELSSLSLLAYSRPVYQVLELPQRSAPPTVARTASSDDDALSKRCGGIRSISDILDMMTEGGTK